MVPLFWSFALVRTIIGLAPLVAPGPLAAALGFPKAEDTTSARVFAGLFGVRDIGLGALILWSSAHPETWLPMIVLNACTDLGDLGCFVVGARGRPDLRRPLGLCASVAGGAVVLWITCGVVVAAG